MAALVDLPQAQPMALPLVALEAKARGLWIWAMAVPCTVHRMAAAQCSIDDQKLAVLWQARLLLLYSSDTGGATQAGNT